MSHHITILIKLLFSTQLRGAADGQILLWVVGGKATNNRKHTLVEENCSELITWSAICHSHWSLFNAGNNQLETKQARAQAKPKRWIERTFLKHWDQHSLHKYFSTLCCSVMLQWITRDSFNNSTHRGIIFFFAQRAEWNFFPKIALTQH